MSFYNDRVVPVLTHLSMSSQVLSEYRRRVVGTAYGEVLEVGIGSGLNLPFYGSEVVSVAGIDPSTGLLSRASKKNATNTVLARASAETIPFGKASFDTVVSTWTLCTIPNVAAALREFKRVLRPEGRLLFVEHGLAPDRRIAWWQRQLTPAWSRLAGGCHLNRKIDELIAAAGFDLNVLATGYIRGRNPLTYMYQGCARPKP